MKPSIRALALVASIATISAAAACQKQAASAPAAESAARISDSDAAAAADAAQAAWTSMDVRKIDAVYAPNIVGFDPMAPSLSTDRGNWTKLQQGFAAMKFDRVDIPDRSIQILDGDDFVVSGTANFTSKDGPVKSMPMRFTDVYHKQADGSFLIVNEHVSQVPAPAKPAA
jgi:ketosteroid isomerase-like protein